MERIMSKKVVISILILMTLKSSKAQSTDCINKMMPCSMYLKPSSTGEVPPASCCAPLKEAVAHDKACLCSIMGNADLLESFGVTADDAFKLPTRCKIAGTSSCSATSPTVAPSASQSAQPPTSATSSKSPAPLAASGKSGGDGVAWSGFPLGVALVTSLLFYLS